MKKLLSARSHPIHGYRFTIWLDTTKTAPDGASPDPDWVETWQWGRHDPAAKVPTGAGMTLAQYRTSIVDATKALAEEALQKRLAAARDAGAALPNEGEEF